MELPTQLEIHILSNTKTGNKKTCLEIVCELECRWNCCGRTSRTDSCKFSVRKAPLLSTCVYTVDLKVISHQATYCSISSLCRFFVMHKLFLCRYSHFMHSVCDLHEKQLWKWVWKKDRRAVFVSVESCATSYERICTEITKWRCCNTDLKNSST